MIKALFSKLITPGKPLIRSLSIACALLFYSTLLDAQSLDGHSNNEAIERMTFQGSVFEVHWNHQFRRDERVKIKKWLQTAGDTLALLNGTMPQDLIQIQFRVRRSGNAVPFAQVLRRHPQGVIFQVNPTRSLEEFIDDWTAPHELVHLFIPYPGEADLWLSEGLATYYQYLLQARAGIKTEQQAWQKIYEGFERGRKDNRYPHLPLEDLSSDMREYRSYMRVYWSGTLYFLEADMALRQASGGTQTLDSVIGVFVNCCRPERIYWPGSSLVKALDKSSGNSIFTELYNEYRQHKALPDYRNLFARLGITIKRGRVVLSPTHSPTGKLRHAISTSHKRSPLNTH